jgi:PAS domain S-box-containing protein
MAAQPKLLTTDEPLSPAIGDYVFFAHDPDGVLTYVSPSIEQVLGLEAEMVLGHNWRDLAGKFFVEADDVLPIDKDEQPQHFYKSTIEVDHADGGTRLWEVQQRPVRDVHGRYLGMEGIAKDVTESTRTADELRRLKEDLEMRVAQRTAELRCINEKLRQSESRYRTVVEDQTEFIARYLPGGKYTFVNEAYCRYVRRPREELIGMTFIPTIYEEDRPRVEQEIASLTPEHPSITSEHRVYRADGTIGWNQWTNRALFDESGRLKEYQSVGRDVTDLRLAADTIREREAHLAHVSRLATMGELVAGIAHEVHQPLHAAKTFAEAARRSLDGGQPESVDMALDCLNEISQAVTRTAKIIRHLRAYTRSKPLQFESVNLNCVVREAAEMIAYETRRFQVKLDWELSHDLPLVRGDQVQLEQVCVNLLMNACEAMLDSPVDQRRLVIGTAADDRYVMMTYRDSGCGIGQHDRHRLFDAFFTTKPGGMGMGLSLCKTIAEAHAGQIWAEPNERPGTTFVFALPHPLRRTP